MVAKGFAPQVTKSTLVPLGGGSGSLGQQRRASSVAASSSLPEKPAGGVDKDYVHNLHQQVYLLETQLKYMKENGVKRSGFDIDPANAEPVDSSLSKLKGSYKQMELDFKASMEQEQLKHDQLKEEALRAVLYEKQTRAEKTKAVEQLARVREQFSSQRQELTAEVVALQRELERCYLTEKTLRMELEQVSTQLQELKAFSEGADTKVLAAALSRAYAYSVRSPLSTARRYACRPSSWTRRWRCVRLDHIRWARLNAWRGPRWQLCRGSITSTQLRCHCRPPGTHARRAARGAAAQGARR